MNLGIEGKTALVVGGTGETGTAVCKALADEGCKLICVSRGGPRQAATIEAVGNGKHEYHAADLMDRLALVGFISKLDYNPPDIIVHVLGGSLGLRDPYLTAEDYAKVMHFNLGIQHEINRAFIPHMAHPHRRWGRIVHFSSNGVKLATGTVPYIAAKGAVEGYVRNFSKELSPKGIVMSAVSPGPIYTAGRGMYNLGGEALSTFWKHYVPMSRWGRGEELAAVVAFLCGDQASYMAGAIVDVDGGMR